MELFSIGEEKFVETNGIKLHTVIIGEGEPLILLHGFPDFWFGWKNIILGLKKDYRLIIPDMRGYNLSDKPEGVNNYKMDVLVEDIKGLIETLNLGGVFLAGHDWGGVVAWAFAEKYPKLVRKLAILNAPHMKIPDYVVDLKIVRAENSSHWVMHDEPELIISSFEEFF